MKKIIIVLTAVIILMVTFSTVGSLGSSQKASLDVLPTSTQEVETTEPEPTTEAFTPSENADKAKLNTAVDEYMADKDFSGTLLIGIGDKIYCEKSYGYSNEENKTSNTNDTIYEIGSITKQFTAAGIMLLNEQGKLSLDDKLSKYYPELDFAKDVTLRQILNMESGIPDYLNDVIWQVYGKEIPEENEYTHENFLDTMKERSLAFVPGESWEYSNSDYYFLGMIIEKVSGMTYEDFIEQYIFTPLKMKSSSLNMDNATASGYLCEGEPGYKIKTSYFFSAGEIVSTAEDMFKWTNAFINDKIVSENSVKEMLKDCGHYYGFGWFLDKDYCFHTGNTVDFYSIDMIEYKHGIKLIALSNYDDKSVSGLGKGLMSLTQSTVFNYSPQTATTGEATE